MFNITPLIRSLLIVNIVVFIVQNLGARYGVTEYLSLWPISSPYFKPYEFFTYMFAHSRLDIFHILFNMLILVYFGPALEYHWGEKKFLFFYMAVGVGAGMIYAGINYALGAQTGSMIGASGALYGILMAYGLTFPENIMSVFFFPVKAKYAVFIMGFVTYALDNSGTVAHLAHIAGAIMGFFMVSYWRSQNRGRY
jgi:membrane associated rhomboid family serine protease